MGQDDGKGQEMQASQSFRQTLIVTSKTTETSQPAETALNHPTTGQEDKPFAGSVQLDDFKLNAMCGGVSGRFVTGVTLVDKGNFDLVPCHSLYLLGELLDLGAVLLIGSRD